MKRTALRDGTDTFEEVALRRGTALRSVVETTMEITSLIVFVAMVGVWAIALGVAS